MNISNKKYIELSQAGLWFEIIANLIFFLAGIFSNLSFHYNLIISLIGIPLLIFNILNILFKFVVYKKNISSKLYNKMNILLLTFILLITIFSTFSFQTLFIRSLFFLILYKLNSKYNYYIKQIKGQ